MRAETVTPTAEAMRAAGGMFKPLSEIRPVRGQSLRRLVPIKAKALHPSFDQLVDALRPWALVGALSYDWRRNRCQLEVIAVEGEDDITTHSRVEVALLGTDWALEAYSRD